MRLRSLFVSERYVLFAIIALGLLLRVWGLRQDLPYHYYGDESYLVYHALKFGTGDLNPHWFVWPTLFQYFLFFLYAVYYVAGSILGWFKSAADLVYLYCKDPTSFFLIGRITAAVFGTASILLVHTVGKVAYAKTPSAALIGALLFACMPLAVEYSHYAVVDTPLTFMVLAAFYYIARGLLFKGRLADCALAGLCAGLAIGTKYSAVFLIIPMIVASVLALRERRGRDATHVFVPIMSLFLVIIGFVAACPFSVIDHKTFIADVRGQYLCAKIGWYGWERTGSYLIHVARNIRDGIGVPLLVLSFAGIVYAAAKREAADLVLLSFIIAYFVLIGWGRNPYARFMLPLLPFLALISGRLLSDVGGVCRRAGRRGEAVFLALLVCVLADPVVASVKIDAQFALPDTRTMAKTWIERNIRPGSRILTNGYGPPLRESPGSIRRRAEERSMATKGFVYEKMRGGFYRMREKVASERISYEIREIAEPVGYLEGAPNYEAAMSEATDAIRDYHTKYDHLVISDTQLYKYFQYRDEAIPERYHVFKAFYKSLGTLRPEKVFAAEIGLSKGPTIRIYRMEGDKVRR